jgi:hypothetical protein
LDLDEGYITEEELFNKNKTKYTDMLFYIYRTMVEGNYTSFSVAEETDILAYIDYLIFCIENPRDNNDEEVNK